MNACTHSTGIFSRHNYYTVEHCFTEAIPSIFPTIGGDIICATSERVVSYTEMSEVWYVISEELLGGDSGISRYPVLPLVLFVLILLLFWFDSISSSRFWLCCVFFFLKGLLALLLASSHCRLLTFSVTVLTVSHICSLVFLSSLSRYLFGK